MILRGKSYTILTIAFFFSGANLMSLKFPVATKLLLLLSIILLFKLFLNNNKLDFKCLNINVKIILVSLLAFTVLNNISTLLNIDAQTGFYNLIKFNIYILITIVMFFTISNDRADNIIKTYNNLVVLVSIIGLVGFVMLYFNILPLISEHEILSRKYNFYGLLWLIENDSILSLGPIYINRLQTLFDEPGSYAFILLPTIIWYQFHSKNKFILIFLYTGLFFSFSIGAFITLILFFLLVFSTSNALKKFKYTTLTILLILFLLPDELISMFLTFIDYKFGLGEFASSHSSGGERMLQFYNFYSLLFKSFFGLGLDSQSEFALTSGILRDMIATGIFGSVFLLLLYFFSAILVLKYLKYGNYFLASLGFIFIMQGIQRASFSQSLLGLLLYVVFIKYINFYKKVKYE